MTCVTACTGTDFSARYARASCIPTDEWQGNVFGPNVTLSLPHEGTVLQGMFAADGTVIRWRNGSTWVRMVEQRLAPLYPVVVGPQGGNTGYVAPQPHVKDVTVVFMTHLDVGYADRVAPIVNRCVRAVTSSHT